MDDSSFVEYLVKYKPNSLVAQIAYSFRVFAVLLIMPILILGLLVRNSSTDQLQT
jgi:hypothetical protein